MTLFGCHSSTHQPPAVVYQNIHAEFLRGDLGTAQRDAEKARKEFAGSNPDWDIKFRLLEAEILTYQGRSQDVIQLLDANRLSYPVVGDIQIKRELLCGLADSRLGRLQRSVHELQEARQLSDSSNSSLEGEVLQTEGLVERHRDLLANAKDSFARSLEFARQRGDTFLETSDLLNLGAVALQNEQYDEALDRFQAASRIAQSIQARFALELALGNAGWAYYKLGDFEKSLFNFRLAEQQATQLGSTHDQIMWLTNTGLSFYQLGDLKAAEASYRKALTAAEADDDKEWIANTHTELGFLFLQLGQLDLAKTQSDEALHAARSWGSRSVVVDALFLQGLLAARQPDRHDAKHLLMQIHRDPVAMPSLRWEVENAIANLYARQRNLRRAEAWYRKSIATFETQRSSLKDEEMKLPFFANADTLYGDYAEFLVDSHRSKEALQLLDLGRARTLEEGLGSAGNASLSSQKRTVNAQAAARRLHATILFYAFDPERSYLWEISGDRTRLFLLPAQSVIESHVKKYLKTILESADPLRQQNEDARYLYDTLVAPAASTIPQGSRVVVIPDESLSELNFETLLVPAGAGFHYWIEDVTIVNTDAIRLVSAPDKPSAETNPDKLLLIGNPISPASEYPNLPNASAEIGSIEKHFPSRSRVVLTQAKAVPLAYAATGPGRFSYIHFVAHATASRLSPLDSAVVLSAPPGHPDSFKLYARDIVRHPLHARLVTISACYGSGLRTYAGEGLVGLSWAFLRAGSHNVIGALWEANDASTPLLMDGLYTGIRAGSRPDAALRAAKLSLIHSSSVYRKPLYWAAFQLYTGT